MFNLTKSQIIDMTSEDYMAIERGKRLRLLRKMANLSRDDFAKKVNVSSTTVSYWENAKQSSINHKNAKKIIHSLNNSGVLCNIEWLLFGTGSQPTLFSYNEAPIVINNCNISSINQMLLEKFLRTSKNAIIFDVKNKNLLPFFNEGDFLGGIWVEGKEITKSGFCIIEFENKLEARFLSLSNMPGKFNLSYTNYSSEISIDESYYFHLSDIKLKYIAPITLILKESIQTNS